MNHPILVIDDDQAYLDLLREVLEEEGYSVIMCHHMMDALPTAQATAPRLIITDLWMKGANTGLATVRTLRQLPETAATPIIICSADVQFLRANAQELRQWGCTSLEKPFELVALLNSISSQLRVPQRAM